MDLCREGEQQDSVELLQVLLGKGLKIMIIRKQPRSEFWFFSKNHTQIFNP